MVKIRITQMHRCQVANFKVHTLNDFERIQTLVKYGLCKKFAIEVPPPTIHPRKAHINQPT